ncbi:MAG: thiamine-monophosphate kinase [Phycisphaerales bacterium JB061]
MNESHLLNLIESRSKGLALTGAELLVGPGDDAAVVRTSGGDRLVLTVDQLVEGRHYEQGTALDLVARKAVARSVSDIAAMGAVPIWAMATGLLPEGYAQGDELFAAMHMWANRFGCPLIGGDIAAGPGPMALTVTVCGQMEAGHEPKLRSGAKAGDEIWITGPVGNSLASGWHLNFEPRVDVGRAASALAGVHAMIDLSDGLGRDAGRVGKASGVMLEIEAAKIPLREGASDWRTAIGDGEDYELLVVGEGLAGKLEGLIGPIGVVREGEPGAAVIDETGQRLDVSGLGWDH